MEKGAVDEREWLGFRSDLRRSGFIFIPVTARELVVALNSSTIRDGVFLESAAARSIRENHLLAQASGILQLPFEGDWLMNNGQQVNEALTIIWGQQDDDAVTVAKANWLVEYSRWDGFAGRMVGPWNAERLVELDALSVGRLLFNLSIPKVRRSAYIDWIQTNYLDDLQRHQPRVFEALCQRSHRQLADIAVYLSQAEPGLSQDEVSAATASLSKSFVNELPLSVRERIFDDDSLLKKLGLSRSTRLTVHISGEPVFDAMEIYEKAQALYRGEQGGALRDASGERWELELRDASSVYCVHRATGREFAVQHAQLVAEGLSIRRTYLVGLAESYGLQASQIPEWIAEAESGPLHPHRFSALDRNLADSPTAVTSRMRNALSVSATETDLVPITPRYYDRLVRPWHGEESLFQFAENVQSDATESVDLAAVKQQLLWSAHSSLVPRSAIARMSTEDLRQLCLELIPAIDVWSLTGLIEAIAARADAHLGLLDLLRELVSTLALTFKDESARLELAVGLGSLIDASLSTSGLFSGVPVFWRRHASLAHAALLERVALEAGGPPQDLASWANKASLQFQTATLADLREEPRWNGFMFTPPQLKQELVGRVLTALEGKRAEFGELLDGLVFGDTPESLESQRIVFFSALSGPLEGSIAMAQELPDFLLEQLTTTLQDEAQSIVHRLLVAAHLAGMGRVPVVASEALAAAVRSLSQGDVTEIERDHWPALLMRLSLAAASSRSELLSAAVLELINSRPSIPMGLRVYAGITACGAHDEVAVWAKAVADYLSRCASTELSKEQAEYLLYVLSVLGESEPLLRPEVAQTWARLQGVAQRIA